MNSRAQALVNLHLLEYSGKELTSKAGRIRALRIDAGHTLLAKYETRKKYYGAGSVVPLHGNCCSGCWVAQSQQTRLRAHDQVLECDHCGRLLYDPAKRNVLKVVII